MTAAGELLAAEIRRHGPVPFHRFMEVALYHPEHGYYRRRARCGPRSARPATYYTAEQIQPVFGILMAARMRQLYRDMGEPRDFTVVELGAGRREMAEAFSEWRVRPGGYRLRRLARPVPGCRLLPTSSSTRFRWTWRCTRAACSANSAWGAQRRRFVWETGNAAGDEAEAYLRQYFAAPQEGRRYEVNLDALAWMERIARALEEGYVLTIDYGYTRAESARFPAGTLMGYRRHMATRTFWKTRASATSPRTSILAALAEWGEAHGLRLTASRRWQRRWRTLARPTSSPRRSSRRSVRRDAQAPAVQDAAVRDGRDVPGAAAEAASALSKPVATEGSRHRTGVQAADWRAATLASGRASSLSKVYPLVSGRRAGSERPHERSDEDC